MPGEAEKDTTQTQNKSLTETIKESFEKTTHFLSETLQQAKDTFTHTYEDAKDKLNLGNQDDQNLNKDQQQQFSGSDDQMKEKLIQPEQQSFTSDKKDLAPTIIDKDQQSQDILRQNKDQSDINLNDDAKFMELNRMKNEQEGATSQFDKNINEGKEFISDLKDDKLPRMSPEDFNMSHTMKVPVDNVKDDQVLEKEQVLNRQDKHPRVEHKQFSKHDGYDRESEIRKQDLERERFEKIHKQKDKKRFVEKGQKKAQGQDQFHQTLAETQLGNVDTKEHQSDPAFLKGQHDKFEDKVQDRMVCDDKNERKFDTIADNPQQKAFSKEECCPQFTQQFDTKGNDLGKRIHKSNKELIQDRVREERRQFFKENEDLIIPPTRELQEKGGLNEGQLEKEKGKELSQDKTTKQEELNNPGVGAFEKQQQALEEKGDRTLAEYENLKNKKLTNYDFFRSKEGRDVIGDVPRREQQGMKMDDQPNADMERY